MKTLLKTILIAFLLLTFSCSKDDSSTPEPENQAPTQVALISPGAEAENIEVLTTFSWEAATDPDGDTITYEVYADNAENPTTLIATTTNTSFEHEERLSLLENYTWKVIAKDGRGGESESAVQSFDTRNIRISVATSDSGVGIGVGTDIGFTTTFDDKLWNFKANGRAIFNSTDGVNWNNVNNSPNYTGISVLKILEYQDKLWLINGDLNGSNEVWNSTDGIAWVLVTDTPGFNDTGFAGKLTVFQDKIWFNCLEQNGRRTWFSEDGVVWSLVEESGNFPIGLYFTVKDDKIYGFSTASDDSKRIDSSVSENGIDWVNLEGNQLEGDRPSNWGFGVNFIVYDNKFWAIGFNSNEIYYSLDGVQWDLAGVLNKGIRFPGLTIKDNKLWVIGGVLAGTNEQVNDVWFID